MPECVSAFTQVIDVPFSRNPLQVARASKSEGAVSKILASGGFDLVHVHTPVASFVTRKAANPFRKAGLKTIYTAHGFHFHDRGKLHRNLIFKILEKYAGRWTDYIIVHNRSDEEDAQRMRIVPKERIVYHPGVGIDLYKYSRESVSADEIARIRNELKIPDGHHIVTMVSEFIPRKRHADVIQAFGMLNRPDIHLILVGEGVLLHEIRASAAALPLSKNIHFAGYRSDIPALITAANCTILASLHEGLPRSVMESLSLEVPVIGSDVRGTRDLLAAGGGQTYPVGDIKSLASLIASAADDQEKWRQMGKVGRRSIAPYNLQNILALHEDLYRQASPARFSKVLGE